MPIDPFWGTLISAAANGVGGALAGGGGQERKSYDGTSADPTRMLTDYMRQLDQMQAMLQGRLSNPAKLGKGSIAHSQPGFTPDPASLDPEALNPKSTLDFTALLKSLTANNPNNPDAFPRRNGVTDSPARGAIGQFGTPTGDSPASAPTRPRAGGDDFAGDEFNWMNGMSDENQEPMNDWHDMVQFLKNPVLYRHKKGGQ